MNSNTHATTLITPLDVLQAAANAAIAKDAAAAKVLLQQQQLQECREANNPFVPELNLFGPPRNLMFAPDPCQTQMRDLATAQEELEAAEAHLSELSGAPTPGVPQAALAPELTQTVVTENIGDPMITATESTTPDPYAITMWTPTSLEQTLDNIWEEMMSLDIPIPPPPEEMETEMERLRGNLVCLYAWVPKKGTKLKSKFTYRPKNLAWINKWVP